MGGTPITEDDVWHIGGKIAFTVTPRLNETPYTSGASSTNNVNQFGVWVSKKMSEHWKLQGNLDFEVFTSNFSGAGSGLTSNSASEQFITLSGGAYYLF